MGDSTEEFEPLFDYHRVQPGNFVCLEDDSDSSPRDFPKRRKILEPANNKADNNGKEGKIGQEVIDCEEIEDEDDWLPPPPKNSVPVSKLEEDSTIRELRLKKQELVSLVQSAGDALLAVEEATKRALTGFSHSSPEQATEEPVKPPSDRAKIVISIQDKAGTKQYRVFADERFEQLFKKYSERTKIDLQKLVFCFDGDKINPGSTPEGLGMEDDDLIEVHVKAS